MLNPQVNILIDVNLYKVASCLTPVVHSYVQYINANDEDIYIWLSYFGAFLRDAWSRLTLGKNVSLTRDNLEKCRPWDVTVLVKLKFLFCQL